MKRLSGVLMLVASYAAGAGDYEATVHFARRVELGLPVSGVVERVTARPGERASKGEVLVALEATPFQAAVEQAQADVTRAAAVHTEAAREYRQAKELYDRTVLSTVELENAKLAEQRALADLRRARARLERARYELAHSVIRAPFDAWVLEVSAEVGASVVSALEARPIVRLAAIGEYEARAWIAGPKAASIRPGQEAAVVVAGDRYPGRVSRVGLEPAGDGRYEVGVAFRTDKLLRAGASAHVEFE